MSQPALAASAVSVYVEHASAMFERSLASTIGKLEEPSSVEQGMKRLGFLVDTLTGFALGAIAGDVLAGVRRWFGAELRDAIDLASWPARDVAIAGVKARYLPASDLRVLVDELGARMHLELARAVASVRELGQRVTQTIERLAPDRRAVIDVMFDLLLRELRSDRLAVEIERGWQAYCAAVANLPMPSITSERSRDLWTAWTRRATGKRREEQRTLTEAAGYIALVG